MTSGEEVFRQLQRIARSEGMKSGKPAPTAEYLTRHGLESFLERLMRTEHRGTSSSRAASCWPSTASVAQLRTSMPRQ